MRVRDEGRASYKSGVLRESWIQSTREVCIVLFA